MKFAKNLEQPLFRLPPVNAKAVSLGMLVGDPILAPDVIDVEQFRATADHTLAAEFIQQTPPRFLRPNVRVSSGSRGHVFLAGCGGEI